MQQLGPVPSTVLVIFYILSSVVLLVLIAAVGYLVFRLNGILERYEARVEPVLNKADQVLTLISEKTDSIGGKAEQILAQGEEMAESVHEKVDQTATVVQRTVNAPIIEMNSLAAALTQGFTTFSRLQQQSRIKGTQPGMPPVFIKEAGADIEGAVGATTLETLPEEPVAPAATVAASSARPVETPMPTIVGSTVVPSSSGVTAARADTENVIVGRKG